MTPFAWIAGGGLYGTLLVVLRDLSLSPVTSVDGAFGGGLDFLAFPSCFTSVATGVVAWCATGAAAPCWRAAVFASGVD